MLCYIFWIQLFVCLFHTRSVLSAVNDTTTDQNARKRLIVELFSKYDPRLAPTTDAGGSTNVSVQIYILSIDSISETNMDFSTSMYLRQSWYDSRLVYTPIKVASMYSELHLNFLVNDEDNKKRIKFLYEKVEKSPYGLTAGTTLNIAKNKLNAKIVLFAIFRILEMRSLELDSSSMLKVWIPDLHMPSEKKALVHQVTVPNKLMHVYPDGKIQYSIRISATIKCNFDLRKFPLDTQHCIVEMESYGYTTDTLRFEWDTKSVSISKDLRIPQFFLEDLSTAQCDKTYYDVSYSCVSFEFSMKRSQGYYITQVFIPSYLIVFLSWVSFWLDIDAVPARISLGLLTVLTMTTQSAGARNNLPKVSYLKAIDVWMAACLGFVFLALVQFAYVNVLSRVEKRRKTTTLGTIAVGKMMAGAATAKKLESRPADPESLESPADNERRKSKSNFLNTVKNLNIKNIVNADREKARNVDRISRYLFPVVFLVFNVVYWFVYVFWIPDSNP